MKFFNITDTGAFFDRILSCSGNVYCRDGEGQLRDLKQAVRQINACSWLGKPERLDEIDVIVEHSADSLLLHRYMMEAVCAH